VIFNSSSLKDTQKISSKIISLCNEPYWFLFEGAVGVGKTCLIKNMLKILGVKDEVVSPTFGYVNEYLITGEKAFHFDLYRCKNKEEAESFLIEYSEQFSVKNFVAIEWSEYLSDDFKKYLVKNGFKIISINIEENKNRIISIK